MHTSIHRPVRVLKGAQKASQGDARRHKIARKIPQKPNVVKKPDVSVLLTHSEGDRL